MLFLLLSILYREQMNGVFSLELYLTYYDWDVTIPVVAAWKMEMVGMNSDAGSVIWKFYATVAIHVFAELV